MSVILMYSGGVDSVLCLNILRTQNITPILFHVHGQMNKKQERNAKQIARILSPKSPYYVFHSYNRDYVAEFGWRYPYYMIQWRHHGPKKYIEPLRLADKVCIGYTRWIYHKQNNQRPFVGNQHLFIDFTKRYKLPFIFPLADMKRPQVDDLFNQLPETIRHKTLSSTRAYLEGVSYLKSSA